MNPSVSVDKNKRFLNFALLLLLIVTAFDLRGARINIGHLSFYWTTGRIALALGALTSIFCLWRRGFNCLWDEYRYLCGTAVLFLGAAGISAAISLKPGIAAEQLIYYGMLTAIFITLTQLPYEGVLDRIPFYLLGIGFILGIIACIEPFFIDFKIFIERTFIPMLGESSFWARSSATLQNPSTLGAYMTLCVILLHGLRQKLSATLVLLLHAVFLSACVFTRSRMAIWAALAFLTIRMVHALRTRGNRSVIVAMGLGVIAICCLKLSLTHLPIAHIHHKAPPMAANFFQSLDIFTSFRLSFWQVAIAMWSDHKWFGIGPGVYNVLFHEYAPNFGDAYFHPHNLFLRVLCEGGIVGFVCFCLFFSVLSRTILRHGLRSYAWPLPALIFFELVEELTRDSFPAVVFLCILVFSVRSAKQCEKHLKASLDFNCGAAPVRKDKLAA